MKCRACGENQLVAISQHEDACIDSLQKKVAGLEAENGRLKEELAKQSHSAQFRRVEMLQEQLAAAEKERDEWKARAMASPCKCGDFEKPEHNDMCEYGQTIRRLRASEEKARLNAKRRGTRWRRIVEVLVSCRDHWKISYEALKAERADGVLSTPAHVPKPSEGGLEPRKKPCDTPRQHFISGGFDSRPVAMCDCGFPMDAHKPSETAGEGGKP